MKTYIGSAMNTPKKHWVDVVVDVSVITLKGLFICLCAVTVYAASVMFLCL